ncbi:MAG: glycosyltransferase family 4 protein [Candidatus Moranbacteria bacterium]|nr:glycosyltransferase family 4 protein [Candidatus Moranbacteria bacterium]
MKIAIHAADLDHERIDGTRVYLLNMLKNFGLLSKNDVFVIYHRADFNPNLTPPTFVNYEVKKASFPWLWTQTCFAWRLWWDKPDVLWMPVHNMPILRRKNLKTVVTIHDLAFKIFPEYFPKKDLVKLNRLSDLAICNANRIIAVSQATKNDILKFYPQIAGEKISVIHHGFDVELFSQVSSEKEKNQILSKFKIQNSKFILYVGAIQPRKNLGVLIEAFEKIKAAGSQADLKLVFAGAPAWQFESTLEKIAGSQFAKDIIITGTIPFALLPTLYQNAQAFVFPSLYEGFGIPVLEAMASGTPVVLADNSSLPEVAGDSALYFKTNDSASLVGCLERILKDSELRAVLVGEGQKRAAGFSWEKCAKQTLDVIEKM